MTGESRVVVAAGSNLGDRLAHLEAGVAGLARVVEIERISDVVESPAEGGSDQADYLNLVVLGRTALPPRVLLDALLEIERCHGRVRARGGGEPRTLDLDLILHGNRVVREPGLVIPHPRWHRRAFVARPLLDVFPRGKDPETGRPLAERMTTEAREGELRSVGRIDLPRPEPKTAAS